MKRFIPILLLFFACCKQQFPTVPKDVIPEDKMKMVLSDMLIADAVAESKAMGGMSEKELTEKYYTTIYANHGISREDFLKSYQFYIGNPGLFNKMYGEILNEMSKREADVGK